MKPEEICIIVWCEESQAVTIELRKLGFNAFSCDLQESSGGHPEWHIHGDVFDAINSRKWHAGIFFPDCTYLTCTANKWYKDQPERKSGTLVGQDRRDARERAIEFSLKIYNCDIPILAMENPIGVLSSRFRKPNQIIQPFQFGHAERKSTCLWTRELPLLNHTNVVEPVSYLANGKKYSPTHYNSKRSLNRLDCLPAGPERSKLRSKTYPGIAKAIADQ